MINCLAGRYEYTLISIKGGTANVWTSDPVRASLLDEWAEQNPERVFVRKAHKLADGVSAGKTDWKDYDIPAEWIRIEAEERAL